MLTWPELPLDAVAKFVHTDGMSNPTGQEQEMDIETLMVQWCIPNDDGTYDCFGRFGQIGMRRVSYAVAARHARKMDSGRYSS